MPPITALLHTSNEALRLGRALETLYPCDEILIVDHGSQDETLRIAHEYGARAVSVLAEAPPSHYLQYASFDWILCLEPCESLSEGLAASLYEWKLAPNFGSGMGYRVVVREETSAGWTSPSIPEVRLIPKGWNRWQGWLPGNDPSAEILEGHLLRFILMPETFSSAS